MGHGHFNYWLQSKKDEDEKQPASLEGIEQRTAEGKKKGLGGSMKRPQLEKRAEGSKSRIAKAMLCILYSQTQVSQEH